MTEGQEGTARALPRLFVALWPDAAARAALVAELEGVRGADQGPAADVRWQPPARWHITLAFLGPAQPQRAVSRVERFLAASDVPQPAPVRLSGYGTFGPVIWIGVEHGAWLPALADRIQRALRCEDRHFRAHLSVGRMRGPAAPGRAKEAAAQLPPHVGPRWTPAECTLVASRTGPQPLYETLAVWPLGDNHPERPAP